MKTKRTTTGDHEHSDTLIYPVRPDVYDAGRRRLTHSGGQSRAVPPHPNYPRVRTARGPSSREDGPRFAACHRSLTRGRGGNCGDLGRRAGGSLEIALSRDCRRRINAGYFADVGQRALSGEITSRTTPKRIERTVERRAFARDDRDREKSREALERNRELCRSRTIPLTDTVSVARPWFWVDWCASRKTGESQPHRLPSRSLSLLPSLPLCQCLSVCLSRFAGRLKRE